MKDNDLKMFTKQILGFDLADVNQNDLKKCFGASGRDMYLCYWSTL